MMSVGMENSRTSTYEDLVFIERVLEVTQCRDRQLVSELCAEAGYFDLDTVCSHVLAFMDDGVGRGHSSSGSSSTSTTSSEDTAEPSTTSKVAGNSVMSSGSAVGGAKPKKSSTTRRQRKQEKKCRAAERHRMVARDARSAVAKDASTAPGCHGSSDDDDVAGPFVISQQLKVLQI